ncbi:hypothetical protein C5E45_32715 [Nocardia nova]|uniref:LtfC/p132/Gp6 beta-sandwich domain-containing protein n=1 Tax=Nocardia nova TaxID=37330 RepID=A0A2S6ACR1_9NOCA|nr:hypothetical protein [Nocardia nova]PPJ31855.1 hypothetical protein C5E45_32715 [Nocardia nova]
MTSTEPLIPPPATRTLPVSLDSDLVVDFRNRNPDDHTQFIDYPAGVTGVLTIYQDLKTASTERITAEGIPSGYHCVIKVPASDLNAVKAGTLWSFRLAYPDTDFVDGTYDKAVVNGEIVRSDGRAS